MNQHLFRSCNEYGDSGALVGWNGDHKADGEKNCKEVFVHFLCISCALVDVTSLFGVIKETKSSHTGKNSHNA